MNKEIESDPEAQAYLALLPLYHNGDKPESARRRHFASRSLRRMLTMYILTVAGASAVFFLLSILLQHW